MRIGHVPCLIVRPEVRWGGEPEGEKKNLEKNPNGGEIDYDLRGRFPARG